MFCSEEELLIEIDCTLDQLIQNAKTLSSCDRKNCQTEISLLQKTQESLVAKFMHTQEYLEFPCSKRKERHLKLLEKIRTLHSLTPKILEDFSKQLQKNPHLGVRPRVGRTRKK